MFRESGCNWAKVVVFGQNVLYSGKMVVFGKGGCIWAKWLYSGKWSYQGNCDVFLQSGRNRVNMVVLGQKWRHSGKSGCIRSKWLYSGKIVVFRQRWLFSDKKDINREKWLYS